MMCPFHRCQCGSPPKDGWIGPDGGRYQVKEMTGILENEYGVRWFHYNTVKEADFDSNSRM